MARTKVHFTCPYCSYEATGYFDPLGESTPRDIWTRAWNHLFSKHLRKGAEGWYRRHRQEFEAALDLPFEVEACPFCDFTLTPDDKLTVEEHILERHYLVALEKVLRVSSHFDLHEAADYEFQAVFDDHFKEVA